MKARYLNIRKRFLALSSKEQTLCRKLQKYSIGCLCRSKKLIENFDNREDEANKLRETAKLLAIKYLDLIVEPRNSLPRPSRFDCSIDSFDESQCWSFFRTQKSDLFRLFNCLRFPRVIKLPNRCKMSGEELFLRGLYELVTGESQYNICENVFGRDQSLQSRCLSLFLEHIDTTFFDLLSDNLKWWKKRVY